MMSEQQKSLGAVFTRPWVVELMLDMIGYTPDENLVNSLIVEPACGDGSFVLPIVERLSKHCRDRRIDINDARDSIRAFDVQANHVNACRSAVVRWLVADGWPLKTAEYLARTWVRHADYLLSDTETLAADYVVGNPPYIRAECLPRKLRAMYIERCKTMTEGTDIYVGFIEKGLNSLKPGGKLCLICADRWMHNTYGRRLRSLVSARFAVQAVYEMHGVDAFADQVSAYPAIILIANEEQREVRYATARAGFGPAAASRLQAWALSGSQHRRDAAFSASVLPRWFKTEDHWPSASPARLRLIEELEARLPTLEESGARVGIGIATGADSVFITNNPEAVERDRMLPLVKTRHVVEGRINWTGCWLINPWGEDGSLLGLDDYPMLANYFRQHRVRLSQRHVARNHPEMWYRTIDRVIPGLQHQSKLLVPDIKSRIEPVLDCGQYYPHHNFYWILPGPWDIRVLAGLLLSDVAEMFISAYAVRMRGGTLRFQAQYLRRIRVPAPQNITDAISTSLIQAYERRDRVAATEAALKAYEIDGLATD